MLETTKEAQKDEDEDQDEDRQGASHKWDKRKHTDHLDFDVTESGAEGAASQERRRAGV